MPQADLDDLFKKQLSDFQAAPSSGLWDKINDELPPPTPLYQRRSFQALTLVCLLSFGLGIGYFVNNYSIAIVSKSQTVSETAVATTQAEPSFLEKARTGFGKFTAQIRNQNSEGEVLGATRKSHLPNTKINTRRTSSNASKSTQTSGLITVSQATYAPAATNTEKLQAVFTDNPLLAANIPAAKNNEVSDAVTALSRLESMSILSNLTASPSTTFPVYKPLAKARKGFHVGGFAGYNNTWIFNKTLGDKNLESVEYNIDFGENYGIALGYNFNDKWGVQLEWVINSVYKQNYTYEKEGRKYDTQVGLNYFQLPLLVKYSVPLSKNTLSYVLGARYARLKSANLDLETPSVRVVDFLNTREVGVIAGLEYEWHMDRRYYLTMGMRSSLGRAFNEWSDIKESNKPFNLAVGFRAGFHYNFVK